MIEECRRETEVCLGILEVNRVDLVGHGRRSDFACNGPLPEDPTGNVRPHVSREVERDLTEPDQTMARLRNPIVRLDLCREWRIRQTEAFDKSA